MPYLIAEGTDEAQRWRRVLPTGRTVVLGREAELAVPWDAAVSRRHAELAYSNGQLLVRRIAAARNPVFFRGQTADRATLKPGDCFVIGQTRFTLLNEQADLTLEAPQPDEQQTFTAADLRARHFSDAGSRIDVLSRLPELFAGAADGTDLHARLVNVLLLGIRHATAAALLAADDKQHVAVLHWDRRGPGQGDFHPSRRLILQAIDQQQSVLHLWREGSGAEFTAAEQADWAFAVPLTGDACRGWALFIAGARLGQHGAGDAVLLHDDLKFAELVAGAVATWRDNQQLRQRQAALKAFFAPQVLEAIARDDPQTVLAPRSANVTVMFCDLRGFSRASEQQSADLLGLLDRVSRALGVATRQILEYGGVVGDFHGDAVMGFWGWPIEQPDKAVLACRAALAIQEQLDSSMGFQPVPDSTRMHGLEAHAKSFRLGIGIASGPAVAGQIGTADQAKVTVFGPVVNLAARLEALTRRVESDILVDEQTAMEIASAEPLATARRLATVLPVGLAAPVKVWRLETGGANITSARSAALDEYATALKDFNAGRWSAARPRLEALAGHDAAAVFLLEYMMERGCQAPPDFDGVIRLTTK